MVKCHSRVFCADLVLPSSQIPTTSYYSMSSLPKCSCVSVLIKLAQTVFVQRVTYCWQLHSWELDWERCIWKGLSCNAQTHQWLKGSQDQSMGKKPGLTDAQVVLKSANKDDANLAREIHHHRQFLHPHIARLYEVIVTETLVWLVLEYCPGTASVQL